MMLRAAGCGVALTTTHLPLKDVAAQSPRHCWKMYCASQARFANPLRIAQAAPR